MAFGAIGFKIGRQSFSYPEGGHPVARLQSTVEREEVNRFVNDARIGSARRNVLQSLALFTEMRAECAFMLREAFGLIRIALEPRAASVIADLCELRFPFGDLIVCSVQRGITVRRVKRRVVSMVREIPADP
jgi:hypothetical protein